MVVHEKWGEPFAKLEILFGYPGVLLPLHNQYCSFTVLSLFFHKFEQQDSPIIRPFVRISFSKSSSIFSFSLITNPPFAWKSIPSDVQFE